MITSDVMAILQVSGRPMTVSDIVEEMGWEATKDSNMRIHTALRNLTDKGMVERRGKVLGRRQSWNTLWEAVA